MKNPITTISGVLVLIVALFTAYGYITETEAKAWTDLIPPLVELIAGLILIFKSGDKNPGI